MAMLNALLEAWTHELAQALEMMTGQSYHAAVAPAAPTAGERLWYAQELDEGNAGAIAVGAEEHVWLELGTRALQGAGIDLVEPSEARSTWFEIVQQANGGAIRAVSGPGSAIEIGPGGTIKKPPENARHFSVTVTAPEGLTLEFSIATSVPNAEEPAMAAAGSSPPSPPTVAQSAAMEVLLDVHLPVSISFGQAQLRLKDVLKLTAGSVVELNRQPEEPVEVIVNDYVIARGEVVIVDGNYAVRIQEIASRQQRLSLSDIARRA